MENGIYIYSSFFRNIHYFSLIPLIDTVRYSFFEYYRSGIKEVGPNFIGMENYVSLLHSDMLKYGANTLILWMIGFIPQIVIALVLAAWFTDVRLKIRGQQFFQSCHLSSKPDYGICICIVILYNVLNKWTD